MMFEKELVEIDDELYKIEDKLNRIASKMAKVISEVLDEKITYSIGWAEAGIETICFYLEHPKRKRYAECFLESVLHKLYSNKLKEIEFDAPFGVYITKEEAEELKRRLSE